MNYRHVYHAGNFADVVKHAVLALLVTYLKQKPAPFRFIDTHGGIGLYDLTGEAAQKTGEFKFGIERLTCRQIPEQVAPLVAAYLEGIRSLNPSGSVQRYPGSPLLALSLLRPGDKLIACELHPQDCQTLRQTLAYSAQAKVLELDGWTAIKSLLPPKERRGLILIDPPFEEAGEFERMVQALKDVQDRFETGTVVMWYPIKDRRAVRRFHVELAKLKAPKLLSLDMFVRAPRDDALLNGTGLVIYNPPFVLDDQLKVLMPYLCEILAQGDGASYEVERL